MTDLKPRSMRPENRVQVDMYDEDGESVHIDIPKAEFQTMKRQADLKKWVQNNPDKNGEDMMVHILEMLGHKDAAKFITTRQVERQQVTALLRLYTGGTLPDEDDATEGDVDQGKSSGSSDS